MDEFMDNDTIPLSINQLIFNNLYHLCFCDLNFHLCDSNVFFHLHDFDFNLNFTLF